MTCAAIRVQQLHPLDPRRELLRDTRIGSRSRSRHLLNVGGS